MKKILLLTLCLTPLAVFQTGEAWAFPSIRDAWRTKYSTSTSSDTVNCQLCHRESSGGEPWNDYGWAVRVKYYDNGQTNINLAFDQVEAANSDNDLIPATNLEEIQANTQPGWTPGAYNTIHFKDGSFTQGQEPPPELDLIVLDPNPNITVTPESVDFSQVKKNRSADLDVQIANIGIDDLTVTSIHLCAGTSSEFSWTPLGNPVIGSGGSEPLAISFSPTNTGLEEGCIVINSGVLDQPTIKVDVTGEGVNKVSGGGGNPSGGGGGGGSSKVFLTKALTGESITSNGIAEDGETLTYEITLINANKNEATVDVTETVPQATVHTTGADDFICAAVTAGSTCDATGVVIPAKVRGTNGVKVLTFEVMVDSPFIDIQNTAGATGVDCALVENTCTVDTPADSDDMTGPDLVVLSPVDGDTVSETGFTVHGTAIDASGIASVFVNDGTTDHPAAYNSGDDTWTVDLPGYTPGTNVTLTVTATDSSSNSNVTVNPAIVVTINEPDVVNPTLNVLSPTTGDTVAETGFTVHGTAIDASGIASVIVNDGSTDHPAAYNSGDDTWTVDLPSYTPGTNVTLTVTATDSSSNSNVTVNPAIVVTIDDPDVVNPALVVLSPSDGDTVAATGFTVNGTASDAGGIASVIVNDGTTNHPATYNSGDNTWTVDLPAYPGGTDVTLTVTATDSSSNVTVNPAIVVHIQSASGLTEARHLINRISYGITPAQLADLNNGVFDLAAYRTAQIDATVCLDPVDAQTPGGIFDGSSNPSANLLTLPIATRNDLQNYAILMAAQNNCQLREVLTQFWRNHLTTDYDAVNSKSGGIQSQTVAWELDQYDTFRANALGNFRTLIESSAKSRAMIYYLDGITNVAGAPNENYGRELMELHTLSVDGGYTDQDVVNAAIAFTGWTVVDPDGDPLTDDSFFTCDPLIHDYSDIVMNLGDGVTAHPISTPLPHDATTCEFAGQAVIDLLIPHASTGEFICEKLTELLVSDNITPAVVSACETAFAGSLADSDQIAQVVEAILTTPEFTNADDYLDKIKTPLELTAGYLRNFNVGNLGITPSVNLSGDLDDLRSELDQMSMALFRFNTPDGFPEQSVDWINSGLIQRRFAFVSDMAFNTSSSGDIYLDPMAFFTASDGITPRTDGSAVQIVDYLMDLALQNQHTVLERDAALDILNNINGFDAGGTDFDTEPDANIKQNRLRTLLAVALNYPSSYQYQ